MRPIAPLDLPDLKPADLVGIDEPLLDWLAVDRLLVDERYQRELTPASKRTIRAMVEGWNWLKYSPLIVAMTELGFEVVDGQHRAIAALLHPAISRLPCFVVDGSTFPERARAFASHGRDRLAVLPGQVYRAEVAAGDEKALSIEAVCRAAGVHILATSPAFGAAYAVGETKSLAAVRAMVARRGPLRAREILKALVAAELAPITGQQLRAAEALCCEPEYAAEFGPEQLTATLRSLGTAALPEAKALAAAKGLPMWRAWAAMLFKHRKARARAAEPNRGPEAPAATPVTAARDEATGSPVRLVADAPAPEVAAIRQPSPRARVIDRRPAAGSVPMGEPPPGRSALDQRRAGA